MGFKKKGAIYSVIALMLVVAVYLNWNYSKNEVPEGDDLNVSNKILGESILVDGLEDSYSAMVTDDEIPVTTGGESKTSDYFATARLSRQRARDEAVNILNTTVENSNTSEDARAVANTNIQVMADNAMVESRIEQLVIAKGYDDCVVFVNDNGINVIVPKTEEGIQAADVAKITDIVMSEASVAADKVKIMETT